MTSLEPPPIKSPMFVGPSANEDGSVNLGNLSIPWQQWFLNAGVGINQALGGGSNVALLGPYSASTNVSADLFGVPDTRPSTWGNTEFVDTPIQFNAPAGMVTRILRVYGNVYVMPKVIDTAGGPFPNVNGYAGMLWGFLTTAPGGSSRVVLAADDCYSFYQAGLNGLVPQHFEFDFKAAEGITGQGVLPGSVTMGLLQPDNILISRLASFLNNLGVPLHMEMEMTIVYQFEQTA